MTLIIEQSIAYKLPVILIDDTTFKDEETGVVSVQLQGACKGCPGAAMTLKMGVERHLKEQVPEVTEVMAVD